MKMNQPDPFDVLLSELLKNAPSPIPDLQQRTRRRIGTKVFQRRLMTIASAAVVLLAVALVWQVWLGPSQPIHPQAELSAAELDSLFAPPPVDPLLVLDRQQQVALQTLGRLEAPK